MKHDCFLNQHKGNDDLSEPPLSQNNDKDTSASITGDETSEAALSFRFLLFLKDCSSVYLSAVHLFCFVLKNTLWIMGFMTCDC